MSGKFLLDTNIVTALLGEENPIKAQLARADEVFIPCIVLGELYFGARKSSNVEKNLARIDELAISNTVLLCDEETARHYGLIKINLRKKGTPIPENDIWIAAIAQQYGLTVVTRDSHFDEVGNLKSEKW